MSTDYSQAAIAEELRHYLVGQLNIISGLLEILQAECADSLAAEHRECLDAMQSAATKALAVLPVRAMRTNAAQEPRRTDGAR